MLYFIFFYFIFYYKMSILNEEKNLTSASHKDIFKDLSDP